ncbi:MAG TPA: ATP-grasp domain-containing protein [Solirubrobacteraceae bacterium]|jgi:succinyl-CoA synthetase beta subunit/citryl-CoA synthetase large subunit|nr:ATP-grasp domain-containing protein [Solirubrobacteraceae bacterium]
MRLYEWEAKRLLAERGVSVPDGALARSAGEARVVAGRWDATVLKAQVLRGGRMKAGLVQFAEDADGIAEAAASLLVAGAAQVLVEERVPLREERFIGALYDPRRRMPILIYTPRGGIDVEQDSEGSVVRVELDPHGPVEEFRLRAALQRAGVPGSDLRALSAIAAAVARAFLELDATLVEINPLAHVAGRGWMALDAHIELDGDALVRHQDLVERFDLATRGHDGRVPTAVERAAAEIDALDHRGVAGRLVEFDGDVALIIGGGGASLTVFDAIRDAGGQPANYCEVGGNPSVAKVSAFTQLLLERLNPARVAVVMNVVSNTRADLIARGVIEGCLAAGRAPGETIAVFRVPGAWEAESRELLAHYGVRAFGREIGVDAAARMATEATAA